MFLKFNSNNGKVTVVRDELIVTDILTVPPNSVGILLINMYNKDNVPVWNDISVEYVKMKGNFTFVVNGEVCEHIKLELCEDDKFIQMTRFIEKARLIDGRTEYFDIKDLKLVNNN